MEVENREFFIPERKRRMAAVLLVFGGNVVIFLALEIFLRNRLNLGGVAGIASLNLLELVFFWHLFRNPYVSVGPDGILYRILIQRRRFLPADRITRILWAGDNIGVKLLDGSAVSISSLMITKEQRDEVIAAIQQLIDSRKRSNNLCSTA